MGGSNYIGRFNDELMGLSSSRRNGPPRVEPGYDGIMIAFAPDAVATC